MSSGSAMRADVQVSDAVLVHGSFSSDLSWTPVLDGLRAGGLTPHPVCLPGHGRRSDEASHEIDLHVHAQSIVDHVEGHQAQVLQDQPDWNVVEVPSGHNVIAEQPEALIDILLSAAGGDR